MLPPRPLKFALELQPQPHDKLVHMSGLEREPQEIRDNMTLPNGHSSQAHVPDRDMESVPRPGEGWDVYNKEAKKEDAELVKDWTANLNALLVFAAIFAAVLTAFVMESKNKLEQDPLDVIVDAMIFLANKTPNTTTIYSPPDFEAPSSFITINCLFFASLGVSMFAALASVVALQWAANYDAAITRGGSSPEERAMRREFLHAGVIRWRMREVIAAIPLLLYCSVALFFGGLALWMWTLHKAVGSVVIVGACMALLFYGGTTLLAVASVTAPFRTPLSQGLYFLLHISFAIFYWAVDFMGLTPSNKCVVWLKKRRDEPAFSNERVDAEVKERTDLGISGVVWLAKQLSNSQASDDRLLALAGLLPELESYIQSFARFKDAPWDAIFDSLGWTYLRSDSKMPISMRDIRAFDVLVQCSSIPKIDAIIKPTDHTDSNRTDHTNRTNRTKYISDDKQEIYWSQHCGLVSADTRMNSLFLLLRDIPCPDHYTDGDLKVCIRFSQWRNSSAKLAEDWNEILDLAISSSSASFEECAKTLSKFLVASKPPAHKNQTTYIGIIRRVVQIGLKDEGKISSTSLILLRPGFESLLIGDDSGLEGTSCLSMPLRYWKALQTSPGELRTLHCDFTLLLAKSLSSCLGEKKVGRVKEVITMLWAITSVDNPSFDEKTINEALGMLSFFEANTAVLMEWIKASNKVPHIHDILDSLRLAQLAEPKKVGPLWRASQTDTNPRLMEALRAFDDLIAIDEKSVQPKTPITPTQHYTLVDLICTDLEIGQPEMFKKYFTDHRLKQIDGLDDPCLRLLAKSVRLSGTESLNLTFVETEGPMTQSWARIAKHLWESYKDTDSAAILQMQASLWDTVPDKNDLYGRALKESNILTHLRGIFRYLKPGADVQGHYGGEAYLLHHILPETSVQLSKGVPAYAKIHMEGRPMKALLAILLHISLREEESRPEEFRDYISEECMVQIQEMISAIRKSQVSRLVLLVRLAITLAGGRSTDLRDVEAVAICLGKALNLTLEQKARSIIPLLVGSLSQMKDVIVENGRIREEKESVIQEACELLEDLKTRLEATQKALDSASTNGASTPETG